MSATPSSFYRYVFSKQNRLYWLLTVLTGVVYFVILRRLFPVISFYADSFTWIGAAQTGQPISMRPIGYSKLLIFLKLFSSSDAAVVASQYLCNLLTNLFLFFTCTRLFCFNRSARITLYIVLVASPFYALYSNYLSSDAFFCGLTVLWFTLLIWILHRPTWQVLVAQLLVLAALFTLRYNAMFFPCITAFALLLSGLNNVRKALWIFAGFVVIGCIYFFTIIQTQRFTGTRTFSAFSGWQLANNALHIVRYKNLDTAATIDKDSKELLAFCARYFNTKKTAAASGASAFYMWDASSPLKKYMRVYKGRQKSYFGTWNALGPVYANFGKTVILQNPADYFHWFVLPNIGLYFWPHLEIYDTYMEDRDTIPQVAMDFYKYPSHKTPVNHPAIYAAVFAPFKMLFAAIHIFLAALGVFYFTNASHRNQTALFSRVLLCFIVFCVVNFVFIVLLAPSVIRYHIFVLTLSYPLLIYLIQAMWPGKKQTVEKAPERTKSTSE